MTKKKEHKKLYYNHVDIGFTLSFDEFPYELTTKANVPGIYREKVNRTAYYKNKQYEMDCPYIADPDGELITSQLAVIMKAQTKAITPEKSSRIAINAKFFGCKTQLGALIVIASRLGSKGSVTEHEFTPSEKYKFIFLDFGPENNRQRLNNVKTDIDNDNHISAMTGMDLVLTILFAEIGKESIILEKCVAYYSKTVISNPRLEFVLYTVFSLMNDLYTKYEEDFMKLQNMIDNMTNIKVKEEFTTLMSKQE